MDEITGGNYSANYTVTGCNEINNATLTGYLTDAGGKMNSSTASRGIYIDSCAPVITLNSPANNSIIPSGTVIDLVVSDLNPGIVKYNVNIGENITLPAPYDISTDGWAIGTYIIRIYANDTLQHSTGNFYEFTIDDTLRVRFINGTVIDSVNRTGIPGAKVSANNNHSAVTNETGFYSIEVTSGVYNLKAGFEPVYYVNDTISVSTIGKTVVEQDIELVRKPTGTITGVVTKG